jgi:hypothetical protein
MDGVREGKRPEITLVVLGPSESSVDHDGATSAHGVLDGIFSHSIMMVPTDPTMLDPLSLGSEFRGEFLGGVDTVVSAIGTNVNSNGGGLTLKSEFGLNSFSARETHLMDHRKLGTGGVAEDGATTELLSSEVVAAG